MSWCVICFTNNLKHLVSQMVLKNLAMVLRANYVNQMVRTVVACLYLAFFLGDLGVKLNFGSWLAHLIYALYISK